jgi:hypothetical protein
MRKGLLCNLLHVRVSPTEGLEWEKKKIFWSCSLPETEEQRHHAAVVLFAGFRQPIAFSLE